MDAFVEKHNLGVVYPSPADVVLSDTDIVQPDILFVSKERSHILTRENVRGAPDLVVEILSPATAERDRIKARPIRPTRRERVLDRRSRRQDHHGTLRGENRFEISGIYGEGQTMRSPTLDGFSFALEEILQG